MDIKVPMLKWTPVGGQQPGQPPQPRPQPQELLRGPLPFDASENGPAKKRRKGARSELQDLLGPQACVNYHKALAAKASLGAGAGDKERNGRGGGKKSENPDVAHLLK